MRSNQRKLCTQPAINASTATSPVGSGGFFTPCSYLPNDLMKVRASQSPPETFPPHSRASPAIR
jgi:hypothetical protein